jgi:N6-adenosine-specific RNA methylase IME4
MATPKIEALPVAPLADADCALLLWGVWPELPGALEVIKAWGFQFKTALIWHKAGGRPGCGRYFRTSCELLLLGVRPNTPRHFRDHCIDQFLETPRGKHSVKPDEIYALIERAVAGPYLELFARQPKQREGWSYCGDHSHAFD